LRSLAAAVKQLGSIKYDATVDAIRNGHVKNLGNQKIPISRQEAKRRLTDLAVDFLQKRYLYDRAPTITEQLKNLEKVERSCAALAKALGALDDLAITQMHCSFGYNRQAAEAAQRARIIDLPPSYERYGNRAPMIEQINSIGAVARVARKQTEKLRSGNPDPKKRGGRRSVLTAMGWSPRLVLAKEGLKIFNLFSSRPGGGHQGGDFHVFINHVFEFATGQEGEVHGQMFYSVQLAVNEARRQNREDHGIYEVFANVLDPDSPQKAHITSKIESSTPKQL
jgi:hypothetical protein